MVVTGSAHRLGKRAWRRVRHGLHAVGVEIHRYPPRDPPSYSLARQLRELLTVVDVACVVDVGANVGQFVRFTRDTVGYDGPIISFEPTRRSYEQLAAAIGEDPLWTGYPVALGAHPGSAEMNVFDSANLNSLHPSSALGGHELAMARRDTEVVEIRRLDQVDLPPGPLLIKTDTQGHDLEVLDGAGDLLARTAAVVIEMPVRPIYDGVPVLPDILGYLDDRGFELAGLYPVLRSQDRRRTIEFDGFFVPHADGAGS